MDQATEAFRKDVYKRLEGAGSRQWEPLAGSTVRHAVFGQGTVSKVLMPDWSNPVCVAVKFGTQEKVFHLATFGDRSKFPDQALPEKLAALLAEAEAEIGGEVRRKEEALHQRQLEAAEASARLKEAEANRVAQLRQLEVQQDALREQEAEDQLNAVSARVASGETLSVEDLKLLFQGRHHEMLLDYYQRLYTTTRNWRALVKAATTWRDAKQPEYALRVTAIVLENLDQLSGSTRATVLCARGGAFLELKRYADAEECARQAIACETKSADPHALLGAVLQATGNTSEAEQAFATARQLAGTRGLSRIAKVQLAATQP